jgi:hypothetical protein
MSHKIVITASKTATLNPVVQVNAECYGVLYQLELVDFSSCQSPENILSKEACMNFICDKNNLNDCEYKLSDDLSKIEVRMPIGCLGLIVSFTLPRVGSVDADPYLQIAKLTKQLYEMYARVKKLEKKIGKSSKHYDEDEPVEDVEY